MLMLDSYDAKGIDVLGADGHLKDIGTLETELEAEELRTRMERQLRH